MQIPQFKECTSCGTLQELYNKINCSIYQLIRNKWVGHTYNVDEFFDAGMYKALLRLKRIVYKRLYNPDYPNECFDTQDIISKLTKIMYKSSSCPDCPCEDLSYLVPTTTTTTTTIAP